MPDPYELLRADIDPDRKRAMRVAVREAMAQGRTADHLVPIQPEGFVMPRTFDTTGTSRGPLIAACIALVVAAVVAVAAVTGADESAPADAPAASPTSVTPTTAAVPTTRPSVAPPSHAATSGQPDAVRAGLDDALLAPEDFGEGWIEQGGNFRAVEFDPSGLSGACDPFESDVFAPMSAAPTATRVFMSPEPLPEFALQRISVLSSEADAAVVFDRLTSAEYRSCATSQVRGFDALRFGEPIGPLAPIDADDAVWYRYERDLTPDVTRAYVGVLVRVGSAIEYLDSFTGLDGEQSVLTDERFIELVGRAVGRAGVVASS